MTENISDLHNRIKIAKLNASSSPCVKTIRLLPSTYDLLTSICRKDQTYDELVLSLVKERLEKVQQ